MKPLSNKLAERKIFGSYFISTEGLHSVDITGDHGLDEVLRVDIHREYLVVLVADDDGTASAFEACVPLKVLALKEVLDELSRIGAAGVKRLEPGQ